MEVGSWVLGVGERMIGGETLLRLFLINSITIKKHKITNLTLDL